MTITASRPPATSPARRAEFQLAEAARLPPTRRLLETVMDHRWPCARPGVAARTRLIDRVVLPELGEVEQDLILGQGSILAPGGCPATDRLIQAMNYPAFLLCGSVVGGWPVL